MTAANRSGRPIPCPSPTRRISRTIICRSPSPGQPTGTYIDIGGGHPVAGSVSFWFYERGWQGIVVEPQEPLAALHRQVRPRDTVVSGLIGRQSGSATLFVVDRLHALTTTVEAYADNAKNYGADVRSVTVPAMTLAELCASHGVDDDRLPEDRRRRRGSRRHRRRRLAPLPAEGRGGRGDQAAVGRAGVGRMGRNAARAGLSLRLFDTLNRFYVADEHPDILARLPSERAPWDAVRHMYEIGRAGENAVHPDHQLALRWCMPSWRGLPHLAPELLASLLDRESKLSNDDRRALASACSRTRRFACGSAALPAAMTADRSSRCTPTRTKQPRSETAPVFARMIEPNFQARTAGSFGTVPAGTTHGLRRWP